MQRVRATDPLTSHAAAVSVPQFDNIHFDLILRALHDHGPQTVSELANRTGLAEQQINKRLPELQKLGHAELTGDARDGASGRKQRVWRRATH